MARTKSFTTSIADIVQKAEKRFEAIAREQAAEVRQLFDAVLEKTQLTLEDVYSGATSVLAKAAADGKGSGRGGKGKKRPIKYGHPSDPSLGWTGAGLQPHWVRNLIAEGVKLEDLLVGKFKAAAEKAGGQATKKAKKTVAKKAKKKVAKKAAAKPAKKAAKSAAKPAAKKATKKVAKKAAAKPAKKAAKKAVKRPSKKAVASKAPAAAPQAAAE